VFGDWQSVVWIQELARNMKNQNDLRQIFTPLQPKGPSNEKIFQREVTPALYLQPYIWCYWEIQSSQPLRDDFSCTIASDGCIDIIVDVNNPQENYLMGFFDKSSTHLLGRSFHYVGVRFLPGMFPYLFNVKASEFSNAVVCMDSIHSKTAKFLIETIQPGSSIGQLRHLFDTYFFKNLRHIDKKFDPRVYEALLIILKNPVSLNIKNDINETIGVGPRHLRRLFDFYIGDNIKSFIKVVRFQNYLRAQHESHARLAERLYYDCGYYDQAHFIKEVKTFCGDTPKKVFSESTRG
jgi:AraC-like DNA-binding protein